jgi:predicted DsbA family dithiol-disulfide isomerase
MKVEIYSDVACPWCYIGKARFERALAAYPGAGEVEVVFRPFQLDPGAPTAARPLRDYLAARYGQREVAERLFEAHFAEGKDIGDADALAELAADAGMDRERVREYLASSEGADEVRARIADAQGLGIGAVPTFVFEGRYAVQGAQPASTFLQALEAVARETAAASAADGSGDDACGEGACSV